MIYHRKTRTIELHPINDTMQPIVVKETDTFRIERLVLGVIRHLRKYRGMDQQIVFVGIPYVEVAVARLHNSLHQTNRDCTLEHSANTHPRRVG